MNESILPKRLIELVSILTPAERNTLPYWLRAEFEGKKNTVRKLCELLLDGSGEMEIATGIRPGKTLSRNQLRKLSDELIGAIKKFLALKQIGDNPNILDVNFLQLLLNRNELSIFPKIFKESQKRNAKLSPEDEGYYRYLHKMEKLSISFGLLGGQLPVKSDWQSFIDSTEVAMTFEYLETLLTIAVIRDQRGYDLKSKFESQFIDFSNKTLSPGQEYLPLLFIYQSLYEGLNHKEVAINQAWETYKKIAKRLPFDSANNLLRIFIYLVNRNAEEEESKELFKLVYEIISWASSELSIFIDRRYSKAIVSYLIILAELSQTEEEKKKWIDECKLKVEEYYRSLPDEEKEEFRLLSIAKINFLEEKYDEVLKPMNMFTFTDPRNRIDHQILIQQVLFERGEREGIPDSL
ncbi:MAG: hypothetical protein AAGC85_18065, partial [Bacteroidota bacterium]